MEIDFEKYGFTQSHPPYGVWEREDFPFYIGVERETNTLALDCKHELWTASSGKIPATNQAVVLLLKAFNLPKL